MRPKATCLYSVRKGCAVTAKGQAGSSPSQQSQRRPTAAVIREQAHHHGVRTSQIVLTAARSTVSIIALFVAYGLLPLQRSPADHGGGLLLGGLAVFVVVLTWEIRSILQARSPGLRAVEALAVIIPLFLLVFSSLYVVMSEHVPGSFAHPLDRPSAFYFTVTTFATVGFGDIVPLNDSARIAVTVQMLLDLIVLGVLLKVVVGVVRVSQQRSTTAVPTQASSIAAAGSPSPDSETGGGPSAASRDVPL
jgi:voltage-gated potassium channel